MRKLLGVVLGIPGVPCSFRQRIEYTVPDIGHPNCRFRRTTMQNAVLISICCICCTGCSILDPYAQEQARKDVETQQIRAHEREEHERIKQDGIARRAAYLKEHPDLAPEIRDCISKATIRVGMTGEQVKVTWGDPYETHAMGTLSGTHEQWLYKYWRWALYMGVDLGPNESVRPMYVYLDNGIVTSWSEGY
jgi:hypothetical protein